MSRNWLINVALLVVVMVSAMFLYQRTDARLDDVATQTHAALCALKLDLQRRHDSTLDYLARHPGREPIPGIRRGEILRSLRGQQGTLDALALLNCS